MFGSTLVTKVGDQAEQSYLSSLEGPVSSPLCPCEGIDSARTKLWLLDLHSIIRLDLIEGILDIASLNLFRRLLAFNLTQSTGATDGALCSCCPYT